MRIGIPKEIKPLERRIALVPSAVRELIKSKNEVLVETNAGVASGYEDKEYRQAGAEIVASAAELYAQARIIVKVKEPIAPEFEFLHKDHTLFSYLHLAANPRLTSILQEKGLTAVAFETVENNGKLPLLAPMSDIAGRLAVHIGTNLLQSPHGGRGILLGGLPATERGHVVILGAGEAGGNAARVAAGLGAKVTVFARNRESLERMYLLGPNVTALTSHESAIAAAVAKADLLIGAVLIPGALAPHIVSAEMVRRMKPGSVIVDIAIDQGGCIETIHATDYTHPTYIEYGVIHFAVTNMPSAVPRTASQALSSVLTPYVLKLAQGGPSDALFHNGINVMAGRVVHPAVSQALAGSMG